MRSLLNYQHPAQDYVQTHKHAFLGVDKRLGKTTLAYRWAKAHALPKFLVVAPKSAIPGWVEQIELDGGIAWDLTSPRNMKLWDEANGDLSGEAFIINPQALFTSGSGPAPKPIALYRWAGVIWDEIVNIKNPQSQINKIAHICLGDVAYRCGLSGEYAPEGPLDIFEQMRWIFGSFMGHTNFWKWRNEFFVESGYDWLPKRGVLKLIKGLIAERGFVLSRKDAGVQNIKPYFDKRYCELPPRIHKVYDHAEKYFEIPAPKVEKAAITATRKCGIPIRPPGDGSREYGGVRFTNYVPVVRSWLLQLAGGCPKHFPELQSTHKLTLLRELLEGEFSGEQVVVSFRFNAEMFAAKGYLEPKTPCSMIWGELTTDQRRVESQKFWEGKTRVMLKQACVHYGMDLSVADTMIRYSLPEAYNDLSQDADRIISPQKNSALMYVDLICKDTVDEDVAEAARDKKDNARYFMDRIAENFTKRLMAKGGL